MHGTVSGIHPHRPLIGVPNVTTNTSKSNAPISYHSITVPCTPHTEGLNPPKEISLQLQLASVDRLAAGWCSAVAGVGGWAVWNEVLITVRSHCSPAAILRELNLGAVHLLVQDLHKQPSHHITSQHLSPSASQSDVSCISEGKLNILRNNDQPALTVIKTCLNSEWIPLTVKLACTNL